MRHLDEKISDACLTELHMRVLVRVAAGQTYTRIARTEHLSARTVRRLVHEVKRLAGVDNAVALGAEAAWRGWLPRDYAFPCRTARLQPELSSGRLTR